MKTFILLLLGAVFLGACAATEQARDVERSGFLGDDYALLKPGGEGEALLVYRNPNADWQSYDSIFLNLSYLKGPGDGISREDAQTLLNTFADLIKQELGDSYEFIGEARPDAIVVDIAITDADESEPVLDTVSSIAPFGIAASAGKKLLTGEPSFVGEVSIEGRVTDGLTGELLTAAVDRRVGGKKLDRDTLSKWGDVNVALEFWAKQFDFRLCELRGSPGCQAPEV